MKKPKRYQAGGLSGIAETANALMSEVDGMANTINYGSTTPSGGGGAVGFEAITPMKKGGYVRAADGCAKRGRTRGKMV